MSRRPLDGLLLAVGTLSALRVPAPGRVDRSVARAALLWAPVAVLPLGAVVSLVLLVGHGLGWPPLVAGLLAVGALLLGTRAFHLDGLSDTVDGLTSSYDRERALAVMKTGTSGPAGTAATVVVLGLQAAGLGALGTSVGGALLAGVVVLLSRWALLVPCAAGLPSARPDGLGATWVGAAPRPLVIILGAVAGAALTVVAAAAGLPWWRGAVAVAVVVVVLVVLVHRAVRRFGGVTGDVFGAAVELTLAALLLSLL